MQKKMAKSVWEQFTVEDFATIPVDESARYLATARAVSPQAPVGTAKRVAYALYVQDVINSKWEPRKLPTEYPSNFRILLPSEVLATDFSEADYAAMPEEDRMRYSSMVGVNMSAWVIGAKPMPTYKAVVWAYRVNLHSALKSLCASEEEFLACGNTYLLPASVFSALGS